MELSYWKSRWQKDKTGWHMKEVYPHLITYWPRLNLAEGSAILVPLCGKSLDLLWLKNQGCRVIGVDVSKKAAKDFFRENRLRYQKSLKASFTIYDSENISIWTGDFFKLKPEILPEISAIYDKAALIALPEEKREAYADRILKICNSSTQILMNTFEYKQDEMNGPPFAVFEEELKNLYGEHFSIDLLHKQSIIDDLVKFQQRGLTSYLIEKVYHLRPKR